MQSSAAVPTTNSTQSASTTSPQQDISVASVHVTVDEKKEGSVADSCKSGETQVNPMASTTSNGIAPPNQAFANSPMVHQGTPALENQFQSLGMSEVPNVVHHEKEGYSGENDEDQPVKLFVGQVR